MMNSLQTNKQLIDTFLLAFLAQEEQYFAQQSLSQEAFAYLKSFVTSGKTLRGSLFLESVKALQATLYETKQQDLLAIAAALELIHSSLLIHDDIIDHDQKRRGQNSIWYQYQLLAQQQRYQRPTDYGQSFAICVGNVSNYLAQQALTYVKHFAQTTKTKIADTINHNIISTNFAEMLDVQIALQTATPSIKEVMEMYRYKTAYYTFALPLQLAAIVAQIDDQQFTTMNRIGEHLGLIFQIQDDKISLFASENKSGKSFASDIREGKKTLFYLYLMQNLPNAQKTNFIAQFGQKNLQPADIQNIQQLFKQYAQPDIDTLLKKLTTACKQAIAELANKELQIFLTDILDFNLSREN